MCATSENRLFSASNMSLILVGSIRESESVTKVTCFGCRTDDASGDTIRFELSKDRGDRGVKSLPVMFELIGISGSFIDTVGLLPAVELATPEIGFVSVSLLPINDRVLSDASFV
jgi:hypothetical protein